MDATPAAPPAPLTDAERARLTARRRALTAVMVATWALLAAMYLFPAWLEGRPWVYQAFTALVLAWLVGFLALWRCPRCRAVLFGQLGPKFCARCGVRFEAAPPRS